MKILILSIIIFIAGNLSAFGIYRIPPEKTSFFHYLMGRINLHQGNIKKSIYHLQKAAKLNRDSWIVREELLELYYITGEYEKGRELAIRMYGMKPNNLHLLELLAGFHVKTDNICKAIEIYNKLIELNSSNIHIRIGLSNLYEINKDYKSAISQYLEILRIDHTNLYARLAIADLYMKLKRYNAAISNYLEALKYGAEKRDIYLQIASIYNIRGKRNTAIKYLFKNLEINPYDIKTLYFLSGIYIDDNNLKQAEKTLLKIKEFKENDFAVLLKLGLLYSDMDDLDRAEKIFREVTVRYENDFNGWYFLGILYESRDKFEEAKQALLRAASIRETDKVYFKLGVVSDRMGNKEQAIEYFKKCLAINPRHAVANNYLGYIWAEKGIKLTKAENLIIKALKEEPKNAAYIDSLGWVFYKQGRYEEALKKLQKASSLMSDAVIYEHLGDTYIKLNMKKYAKDAYKRALKLEPENKNILEKLKRLKK